MILQRLTTRARTSWFADYVNLVVMPLSQAPPPPGRRPGKQHREPLRDPAGGGLHDPAAAAWGTTLGKRITAYPKVHVIDSGLAGWLLGLGTAKISSRDPAV